MAKNQTKSLNSKNLSSNSKKKVDDKTQFTITRFHCSTYLYTSVMYRDDRKSCLSLQSTKWKNFLLRLTWLAQPSYIYIEKLIGEYFLNLLKVLNLEKTVKRNK